MESPSLAIEAHRAGAALCAEKSTTELLAELLGLLPLADMEEVGCSRSTGPLTYTFRHLWMTRKKRKRLKPRPSCKRCGAAVL